MKYAIFTLFILVFGKEVKTQSLSSLPDGKKLCWQYVNVAEPFNASIIKYFPNNVLCGRFPSASIAIVKLENGDTLRVVQFCSWIKEIKAGDIVTVNPVKHIDTESTIYPVEDDALTCRILKTIDAGLVKQKPIQ